MKVTMNYIFAHSIAKDEADRNMRKHGRKRWNIEDYNIAAKRLNEIMDNDEKISYELAQERYFENGPVRIEKHN